ncbi:MAG TPA: hypothetical protein VFO95_09795 [Gemmatimonadales bacterium]|nr:hypothetical protein [Gemmatimonadales bacterium]
MTRHRLTVQVVRYGLSRTRRETCIYRTPHGRRCAAIVRRLAELVAAR